MIDEQEDIPGKEAAKLLGVSYARLYGLMEEGKLTRLDEPNELRKHTPLRFLRSEVEALAARNRKKSSVAA